jgi:hypothetical protein
MIIAECLLCDLLLFYKFFCKDRKSSSQCILCVTNDEYNAAVHLLPNIFFDVFILFYKMLLNGSRLD